MKDTSAHITIFCLQEYRFMLSSETLHSFLYTLVHNLVTDYKAYGRTVSSVECGAVKK